MNTTTIKAEYSPLMATVVVNKNNPDKLVAFVGQQLCFFGRVTDLAKVKAGAEVEVMITRAKYAKYPETHRLAGKPNFGFIDGVLIQLVDRSVHELVHVDGFMRPDTKTDPITTTGILEKDGSSVIISPPRGCIKLATKVDEMNPTYLWVDSTRLDENPVVAIGLTKMSDGRWDGNVKVPLCK